MAIAAPAAPMQDAPDPALIAASLQHVWQQPLAVTQLQRLTAGATKQTWLLDVAVQGTSKPTVQQLILQTLPPSKLQSMDGAVQRTLTPAQDARITQLAHAHGVPVPELVLQLDGSQGIGHGQITRFVAGETLAPKILRDARFAQARGQLTADCAQALAKIHRIPSASAAFLPTKDAHSQWRDERAQVDASGVLHPALEWGLRWVEERLDDLVPLGTTPVHGDFRLGNLIVNDSGLAAVIDWELAHLGDPMQDLAWLCLRTWRFGGPGEVAGIGRRADLFTHYEQAGGQAVEEARVFFWEMACQVRWAVMCLGMGLGLGLGTGRGAVSLEHTLVGRRMVEPLWDMIQLAKTRGDAA